MLAPSPKSNKNYKLTDSCWGIEEFQSLQKVIESENFTMGNKVKEFESKFAKYHGKNHGIMVNSGSSANLLSIASLFFKKKNPLKKGDEVIVPALSWSTSYFPLQQYGLKCKFIDINIDTLNVDFEVLKKSITEKTKLILAVNILGNPCELHKIKQICNEKKIYLFQDNCESLDAEIKGKKAGTFGDVSSFSFFYSHHINTMEGGMILTDSKEIANLCYSMRSHGWTRNLIDISKKRRKNIIELYDFIYPGYNIRPLEFSAACGLEQIKKLPKMTQIRRKNLKFFNQIFCDDPRFMIQKEIGNSSSFSFPIILKKKYKLYREKLFRALTNSGIEFRMVAGGCFTRHKVYKFFDSPTVPPSLVNANYVHDNGFCVGNYAKDLSTSLKYLKHILDNVITIKK